MTDAPKTTGCRIAPPRTEWEWREVRRGEWRAIPPDRPPQIVIRDCDCTNNAGIGVYVR